MPTKPHKKGGEKVCKYCGGIVVAPEPLDYHFTCGALAVVSLEEEFDTRDITFKLKKTK